MAFEFAAAWASVKVFHMWIDIDLGFVAPEVGVECLGDTLVCTSFYASVIGIVSTEKGQGCNRKRQSKTG